MLFIPFLVVAMLKGSVVMDRQTTVTKPSTTVDNVNLTVSDR
jgi:hypothetical protein